MPLTPAQEAALRKYQSDREAYDNSEGVMLRSGTIERDVSSDAGISSIDDAMRRNSHGRAAWFLESGRPSTPEELSILNQAKQGLDQGNFVRAAKGGLLDKQAPPPQSAHVPGRRTMDFRYEANNVPPKMGGGIGNLLSHLFGGGGSEQQAAPAQQAPQPQQAPPQQGGQNWAQLLLEGFGAGAQGMSVPQLHMAQAQAKIKQFEVQQQMRMQRAQQAMPAFKQKMPSVAKFAQQAFQDRVKEAKAQGLPVPVAMTAMDLDEGSRRHDKVWEGVQEMQVTEVDQDVMTLLPQGRQFTASLGILPFEEQDKVNAQAQQAINAERMRLQKEMSDALQVGHLFDRIQPLGAQQNGQPLGGELIPNDRLQTLASQRGITPEQLAGQLTNAPIQNQLNPQTGSIEGQSLGRIPDSLVGSGFNQSKLPLLKQLTEQENTGAQAMAGLPADLMKLKANESMKANLAEQQASIKEQQITKRGEETLKQIQAKSKEAMQLQSVKTADATTLKKVDHELRLTRDAAKDKEAMARVRERLSTIPAGSLTFEQRAAMKVFEATEAGGRVDANNAAKSARQLAAMANTSERDVFRLLLESGAVGAGDLMRATKMADTKIKADPDSSGSLSREVLGAIHDIRAERAVDPVTEDINFALSASDDPAAIRQLNILRNVYRSHQAKAETPAQRKAWDEALAQVDENLNGVKKEAIDKKQVFRAPYTMADGTPGEALLTPDPDSATGFSVVQIPTAGGTQPAMAAKKSLVEQQFGSAGERKALVETKNTIEQAESLLKDFDTVGKHIVGPIDQFMARVGKVADTVPEDRLQYEATLNAMATDFRHQLFGSALTAQEVKSALKSIPDMDDQDSVFKSKLNAMLKSMKRLQGLQEESMGKRKSAVGKKSDDDRLAELLGQGATRDEAIRIMVEEGR